MTYAELADTINSMTDEQLNTDVTVYVSGVDEFYSLSNDGSLMMSTDDNDVLDIDHPYLVI